MAVSAKVGRPYRVAVMDFRHDPEQELYDKFYKACRELTYPDMTVVGRAFGVHWITVWRWKAGQTFPKQGIALQLIAWIEEGKPTKIVTQAEAAASMF